MYSYIEDPNHEVIDFIQNLRELEDEVIVDSEKLINKFIVAKRFSPKSLFIKKSFLNKFSHESSFKKVIVIDDDIFKGLSGYKFSKGVLATFEKPTFSTFEELEPPYIILNGLSSPENIGSIVRTITGLGFKSLIIDGKTCSPYLRRCIRVSMGNINFLNIHRTQNLKELILEKNINVYYAANEEGAYSVYDSKPSLDSAFMIGSEGHGIQRDLLDIAKEKVKIPVTTGVLHYNASIACAIIASDWSRKLNLIR